HSYFVGMGFLFIRDRVGGFLDGGGDPAVAAAVIEVRPRYLDAALDAMDERWGGLEGYVRDGLRVPAAVLERLREGLVISG
ncbi:tyrosine-protein phosphatase, partial [Streptomyces californicus]|uniref:tyrosine-protein phosphatase n=1 Tax=Streptomyces californicus TaxID=67351 RepID=UPI003673BD5B